MSYTEMAQLELMNAAANVTSKEDLDALRLTLSLFFAERAQRAIDKMWDEGTFDQKNSTICAHHTNEIIEYNVEKQRVGIERTIPSIINNKKPKKNMKNLIKSMCVVLCGMMISATFTACGSDDDNGDNGGAVDSRVVGTWTSTIGEGWTWDDDGVLLNHWKDLSATTTRSYEVVNGRETGRYTDKAGDGPEWMTVTFNADGSYFGEDEEESFKGTFTTKDGVMTLFSTYGADRWNYSFEDGKLKLVAEEYEDGVLVDREINWYVKGLYQEGM